MDSAGFLIMHGDFLLPSATASDVQYVHITEKEKHIAEDLIKKNYLIKKECRHLDEIQKQSFYEVNLTKIGVDTLTSDVRCSKYQLRQIKGTNSYLGMSYFKLFRQARFLSESVFPSFSVCLFSFSMTLSVWLSLCPSFILLCLSAYFCISWNNLTLF